MLEQIFLDEIITYANKILCVKVFLVFLFSLELFYYILLKSAGNYFIAKIKFHYVLMLFAGLKEGLIL